MKTDYSLKTIINELPLTFVDKVFNETDSVKLRAMHLQYTCYNRRSVIKARIEALNPLISNP